VLIIVIIIITIIIIIIIIRSRDPFIHTSGGQERGQVTGTILGNIIHDEFSQVITRSMAEEACGSESGIC